jgi:SAM-dependent methyltransferase
MPEERATIIDISQERWKTAQKFEKEFAQNTIGSDDDWNLWWMEKYSNYSFLEGKKFQNVLEVGCGPHTNVRYILPKITVGKIWLEDPLIQYYITHYLNQCPSTTDTIKSLIKKPSKRVNFCLELFSNLSYSVDLSSAKLEDLPYKDGQMDLVICINVLDHVNNYDSCMSEMSRVLKSGGILILGQDLTNAEDLVNCPEVVSDIGHPIKVDHTILDDTLSRSFETLIRKILPREEGRNPKAHYGTYLGVFQKK